MYPFTYWSIQCLLVLDLTFLTKLNICSWRPVLPNRDYINKTCFLISGNSFHHIAWYDIIKRIYGWTKHINGQQVNNSLVNALCGVTRDVDNFITSVQFVLIKTGAFSSYRQSKCIDTISKFSVINYFHISLLNNLSMTVAQKKSNCL